MNVGRTMSHCFQKSECLAGNTKTQSQRFKTETASDVLLKVFEGLKLQHRSRAVGRW